ncbi:MAG: 50S ribosomal protein L3P [Candidatus Bathyarchaeota archaeon B24]|nr:MAG: 50S ribosomal protein L3P [Candidatus Bathyarchaeota archaeon B24]RLI26210.1 MAG: 50S ribosomal protein L3 [Candidatus Bathyarchaeota archaeon]
MGRRKKRAPRRGSLAYIPKVRARSIVGRISFWPSVDYKEPKLLGFAGYKAGMTHVIAIEDHPRSPHYGKEVFVPVTVLDAPPLYVAAVRCYEDTPYGLKALGEVWVEKPPKDLERVFTVPESFDHDKMVEKIKGRLDRVAEVRVLTCTQPRLSGLGKKTPELFEVGVGGGSVEERFEYCLSLLGKEVRAKDALREGMYVDVSAVTKGKGFQGVIKRWGVKRLPHKSRKGVRKIGTLGPWVPSRVLYTVPRAGQLGFFQRIEYNKRIIKVGENGEEITPKGGFVNYGVIRGDYILIKGSIPGPVKRLVRLRVAARPPRAAPEAAPQILYVKV